MTRTKEDWFLLLTLAGVWGTSFAANAVAVASIAPATVVWGRLWIAAILLLVLARAAGWALPARGAVWGRLVVLGLLGNALPFFLITWGQQRIDSGLAGVLMAVMPVATMVLAHLFVPGERLHARGVFGFTLGFGGVVLLVGPSALGELGGGGPELMAQLAVLGGALCYAANTIVARNLEPMHVVVSAGTTLAIAALVMTPAGIAGIDPNLGEDGWALACVIWMGLVSTALATVIYFRIVSTAGPTFLSLINYLIPLIALAVGVTVLGEPLEPRALGALGLILGGVALSQAGTSD